MVKFGKGYKEKLEVGGVEKEVQSDRGCKWMTELLNIGKKRKKLIQMTMILENWNQERKEKWPYECRNVQWNKVVKNVAGAVNSGKEEKIMKSVV